VMSRFVWSRNLVNGGGGGHAQRWAVATPQEKEFSMHRILTT